MNLTLDTTTETWVDVEKLVYHTAWSFIRKYHVVDIEEVLAEARFAYALAFRRYDADKGAITTRVREVVWHVLQSKLRKDISRQRLKTVSVDATLLPTKPNFDLNQFCRDLSQDASFVVNLLIETHDSQQPRTIKRRLINHLTEIGWATTRIVECFKEIREALS